MVVTPVVPYPGPSLHAGTREKRERGLAMGQLKHQGGYQWRQYPIGDWMRHERIFLMARVPT